MFHSIDKKSDIVVLVVIPQEEDNASLSFHIPLKILDKKKPWLNPVHCCKEGSSTTTSVLGSRVEISQNM